MKVVILCGGQGTRIRGIADDLPKPMIPIGDLHYRNDKLLATGFRLRGDEGAEIDATLGLCRAAFAAKETTG